MKDDDLDGDRAGGESLLSALRRRRYLALFVFCVVFAAVAAIARSLPDVYRSSATVLIERQQIPDELVRSTVTGEIDVRLRMISQEILSRSRLEGLLGRFNLYADMQKKKTPVELIIQRMREEIEIDLRGGERKGDRATVAFGISYRGRDPRTVALVANTLASFYIEENLKVREKQAVGTVEFLRTQLDQSKAKLDELERKVSAFRELHIGELPEQLPTNLSTIEQLNAQLRLNSDNQIKLSERRAAVAEQLAHAEGAGPASGPEARAARLAQLNRELAILSTRFTPEYPDIVRVKAEIATLERQVSADDPKTATSLPDRPGAPAGSAVSQLRQAAAGLDADLRALKQEAENLKASIAKYQRRVEGAPQREQEFQGLAREYESTKEGYKSLLVRQREAELAESMEQRQKGEQFRILDPAIASEEPAAPNRWLLLAAGFGLALGLGVGAAFVAERMDRSIHTSEAFQKSFGVPVLATISRVETEAERRQRKRRGVKLAMGAVVVVALCAGSAYWVGRGNEQITGLMVR
jgi:polysaccharide chain length determinant protein (PEP-CTERM system associated)